MKQRRDRQEQEARRLQAARLFEKGYEVIEVARRFGVERQVAHRWKQAWQKGGKAALKSKGNTGPKPKMNQTQTQQLVDALLAGPRAAGHRTELWTLPRVTLLIEKLTGVRYHPGHVWKLLGTLGFSCQRPERRALERDEKAIRHWKRKTWPALKKTPGAKDVSSSSSMKAE